MTRRMGKGRLKRRLALFMSLVLCITTLVSLNTIGALAAVDVDAPVLEGVECTPSKTGELTRDDYIDIKIKAYDAISGIKSVECWIWYVPEGCTSSTGWEYSCVKSEKEDNTYCCRVNLNEFGLGSAADRFDGVIYFGGVSIIDNSSEANKLRCESYTNTGYEKYFVNQGTNPYEYLFSYQYKAPEMKAEQDITVTGIDIIEGASKQEDGSYSAYAGKNIVFEVTTSKPIGESDRIKAYFLLHGDYKIGEISGIDGKDGKYKLSCCLPDYDYENAEIIVKGFDIIKQSPDSATEQNIIKIADGVNTSFEIKLAEGEVETVKAEIKLFKDGEEMKDFDQIKKGQKLEAQVTLDKEIPHLIDNGSVQVSRFVAGTTYCEYLTVDSENKKLFKGTIDINECQSTGWIINSISIPNDLSGDVPKEYKVEFEPVHYIVLSKDGSTSLDSFTVRYTIGGVQIEGNSVFEQSCIFGDKVNKNLVEDKIKAIEESLTIKPDGWEVSYSDSYDKKIISLEEFYNLRMGSWSDFLIKPVYNGVVVCLPKITCENGYLYIYKNNSNREWRKFEKGTTLSDIADILADEMKKNYEVPDSFKKFNVTYQNDSEFYLEISVEYEYRTVLGSAQDGMDENYYSNFKKDLGGEEFEDNLVEYIKSVKAKGDNFDYWIIDSYEKSSDETIDEYYERAVNKLMEYNDSSNVHITLHAIYKDSTTYTAIISSGDMKQYVAVVKKNDVSEEEVKKALLSNVKLPEVKGAKNLRYELTLDTEYIRDGFKQFYATLKADNALIYAMVHDYENYSEEYPTEIVLVGCDVGTYYTLPTKVGQYDNISWRISLNNDGKNVFYSIKDKLLIESNNTYLIYGANNYKGEALPAYPGSEPEKEPEKTPEKEPEKTPEKEPEKELPKETTEKEIVVEQKENSTAVEVVKEITIGTNSTKTDEKGVTRLDEEQTKAVAEDIVKTVEAAKKAKEEGKEVEKTVVKVSLADATTVPVAILEAAKGENVDVVLDMGGYSWVINGEDIKASNLEEINLEVKEDEDAVPSTMVEQLAGDKPTKKLSLTHNGNFGFKATLNINMDAANAGKYGNLYYYDSTGKLVFQNAGIIGEDGICGLDFSHASEYVIVVDTASHESNITAPNTGDELPVMPIVLMLAAMTLIGMTLIVKKSNRV